MKVRSALFVSDKSSKPSKIFTSCPAAEEKGAAKDRQICRRPERGTGHKPGGIDAADAAADAQGGNVKWDPLACDLQKTM